MSVSDMVKTASNTYEVVGDIKSSQIQFDSRMNAVENAIHQMQVQLVSIANNLQQTFHHHNRPVRALRRQITQPEAPGPPEH